MSGGKEAAEIGIALAVLGEEHQMMRVFGCGGLGRAATTTAGRNRDRDAAGSPGLAASGTSDSTRTSAPKMGLMPRLAQALAKRTAP